MKKLDTPLKSINPSNRFIIFFTKRSSNANCFHGVITQTFSLMKKFAYIGLGKDVIMRSCVRPQCYGKIGGLRVMSLRSDQLFILEKTNPESPQSKGVL